MAVTSLPYGVPTANDADVSSGTGTGTAISTAQLGLIPNRPFAGLWISVTGITEEGACSYVSSNVFGGTVTSLTNAAGAARIVFTFTTVRADTSYRVFCGASSSSPTYTYLSKTTSQALIYVLPPFLALKSSCYGVLIFPEDNR